MVKPVFKTFADAEGFKEWAILAFTAAMLVVRGEGLEPTVRAQDAARTILSADCNSYKKIYKQAALKYHPDRRKDVDTTADMALINSAYEKRQTRACPKRKLRQQKMPKSKSRPKRQSKSRSKPEKRTDLSMGQAVAGLLVGGIVGYTAKECKKSRGKRQPRPPSPGRRKRPVWDSSSSEDDSSDDGQKNLI